MSQLLEWAHDTEVPSECYPTWDQCVSATATMSVTGDRGPSGTEHKDGDAQPAGGGANTDPDRGAVPGAWARATLAKIRLSNLEGVFPGWRCHHKSLANRIKRAYPSGRNKLSNIDPAMQAFARRFPEPQPRAEALGLGHDDRDVG